LRTLTFAVITVLISAIGVLGIATPAQAYGEGTILALVNQARAANNLGPLTLNSSLSAVSLAWANQMAANGVMSHNPNYTGQIPGGWSRAGENVAQGFGSPTAVHNGWMNSSGHRANILGDYTDIGIAFIEANGTTWAVENFAKYGASVPPPNPPDPPSPSPSPSPSPLVTPTPSPSPSASTPSSPPGSNPPKAQNPKPGGSGSQSNSPPAADSPSTQDDPGSDQEDGAATETPSAEPPQSGSGTNEEVKQLDLDSSDRPISGGQDGEFTSIGLLAVLAALGLSGATAFLLHRRWF
ncbi:MAG: CAP domain-containing protein, partial [Cryobacterium sp.]|nr:CAP domain-containing protein [Cryobacterium sp.]